VTSGRPALLRSVLYTPGHDPERIAKAPRYGADALCLVLEDSVPVALKDRAREVTAGAIATLAAGGHTVLVKINALDEDGLEDVARIAQPGLAGLVVPKLREPADVQRTDAALREAEARNHCEPGSTALLLLVETPRAALSAFQLAGASPRVISLIAGTAANGDMARELGFRWTAGGLERLHLRSKLLLDARAADVEWPLDGVFPDVRDIDGLVAEAEHTRDLGYRGKLVVHPSHVEPVNRVFTPGAEEVALQRRVLEAFERSVEAGTAATVVDGRFVDYAMAKTARKVIEFAERAAR
jgi:citrate lyase subunit beta/citryl-CoA lyase